MNLCRCPHCQSTFQVSVPPEHPYWDDVPTDDDGMTLWVCLECHQKGLPPVTREEMERVGHDTSYRQ
jgi:hypothetical protein